MSVQAESTSVARPKARKAVHPADVQHATDAGLDLLRVIGRLVLHNVSAPGRPDLTIDHVVAGPSGVYVINTIAPTGSVSMASGILVCAGNSMMDEVREVAGSAAVLRELLSGAPVAPILCFQRNAEVAGVVGEVAVCSTENILELLSGQPDVLNAAGQRDVMRILSDTLVQAVRREPRVELAVAPKPKHRHKTWSLRRTPAKAETVEEPPVVELTAVPALEPEVPVEDVVDEVVETVEVVEDVAEETEVEVVEVAETENETVVVAYAPVLELAPEVLERVAELVADTVEEHELEAELEAEAEFEAEIEAELEAVAEVEDEVVEVAEAEVVVESAPELEIVPEPAPAARPAARAPARPAARASSRPAARQAARPARVVDVMAPEVEVVEEAAEVAEIVEVTESVTATEVVVETAPAIAPTREKKGGSVWTNPSPERTAAADEPVVEKRPRFALPHLDARPALTKVSGALARLAPAEPVESVSALKETVVAPHPSKSTPPAKPRAMASPPLPAWAKAPTPRPNLAKTPPPEVEEPSKRSSILKTAILAALIVSAVIMLSPKVPSAVDWGKGLFVDQPIPPVGTLVAVGGTLVEPAYDVTASAPVPVSTTPTGTTVRSGNRLVAIQFRVQNKGTMKLTLPLGARLQAVDALGIGYSPTTTVAKTNAGATLPKVLNVGPGAILNGSVVFSLPKGREIAEIQLRLPESKDGNESVGWIVP